MHAGVLLVWCCAHTEAAHSLLAQVVHAAGSHVRYTHLHESAPRCLVNKDIAVCWQLEWAPALQGCRQQGRLSVM